MTNRFSWIPLLVASAVFLTTVQAGPQAEYKYKSDGFKMFDQKPKKVRMFHHASWMLLGPWPMYLRVIKVDGVQLDSYISTLDIGTQRWPMDTNGVINPKSYLGECPDYTNNDTDIVYIAKCADGSDIAGPWETDKINRAVDQMEQVTTMLLEKGVDLVLFTTQHHRWNRWRDYKAMPPRDINDSLVINEYIRRHGPESGVNLMRHSSRFNYHVWMQVDLEHPLGELQRLYTGEVFRLFYANDGLEYPEEYDARVPTSRIKEVDAGKINIVDLPPDRKVKMGQTIELEINVKPEASIYRSGHFHVVGYVGGCAGIFETGKSYSLKEGISKVSLTIPREAGVHIYSIGGVGSHPLEVDSAQIQFCVSDKGDNYIGDQRFLVVNDQSQRPWVIPVGVARTTPPLTVLSRTPPTCFELCVDPQGRTLQFGEGGSQLKQRSAGMSILRDRRGSITLTHPVSR